MHIVRFSAVEMFGVPIEDLSGASDHFEVISKLRDHSVHEQEVSTGIVDITPYYWSDSNFRYLLSRKEDEGPVTFLLAPRNDEATIRLLRPLGEYGIASTEADFSSLEIPTQESSSGVIGPTPPSGRICLHELVACID
jgi:hypothetical protein